MQPSFEQQLAGQYSSLSAKLRDAADYVVANPIDVATRSLRKVSKDAKLSPATFSRMSAALGYKTYEELRDVLRMTIEQRSNSFSNRVEVLQQRHEDGDSGFFPQHLADCAANIQNLNTAIDRGSLEDCVERLHLARRVLVSGALGSTGAAEYLTYMASFIAANWSMVSRMGASMASGLVGLSKDDILIIVTNPPCANMSVRAAHEAHKAGAFVIVITDSHTCPALVHASASFIVPTQSQHFFSSYASTIVLCESIVGLLAARSGAPARERIAEVELRNRHLSELWDG